MSKWMDVGATDERLCTRLRWTEVKDICPLFIAVLVFRAQRWPVDVN